MMRTSITLELKTREAYQLFTRKIKGEHLFIDAILHKFNKIDRLAKKNIPGAIEQYNTLKHRLSILAQQFETDNQNHLGLIQKNSILRGKAISVKTQFYPEIKVKNALTVDLIQLIQRYDTLFSTIKLLHLAGCFESTQDYYANIKCVQTKLNQILGHMLAAPVAYVSA